MTKGGSRRQHALAARGIPTSGRARATATEPLLAALEPRWTVPAREWIPETGGWRERELHLSDAEIKSLIETAEMYHEIQGRTYLLRPADLANATRKP